MTARIVMFSGGVGSWAAAKRVADRHGSRNLVLLFADTRMEDEDLYRFLGEAAANVGGTLERVVEGRDPWQVFFDERFLGNTRADPCSKILKRRLLRRWIEARYGPGEAVVSLGFDWTEGHRLERARPYWRPYRVEAPLCDPPYLTKRDQLALLKAEGIRPPKLYELGFPHNNCGGFCIKAGQAHFRLLLETMPERYAYHERKEQELREHLGKNVAVLRDRTGKRTRPMTLRAFRERVEADGKVDTFEWGGCGCFA
jgi:3'-phosphoadenosine 5'-phosphosulfate sulfotransferase (PAPS reductase)/FAD synthetase